MTQQELAAVKNRFDRNSLYIPKKKELEGIQGIRKTDAPINDSNIIREQQIVDIAHFVSGLQNDGSFSH